MKFEGHFVDMMCKDNPEYKKSVIYEKGEKVLYVLILKAIYGMIEGLVLWYDFYIQHYHMWGSNLTYMNNALKINRSMNTNSPSDGLWTTTRSQTWMKMLTQLLLTRLKKNWEAILHNRKEAHITWYGHQVYWL